MRSFSTKIHLLRKTCSVAQLRLKLQKEEKVDFSENEVDLWHRGFGEDVVKILLLMVPKSEKTS